MDLPAMLARLREGGAIARGQDLNQQDLIEARLSDRCWELDDITYVYLDAKWLANHNALAVWSVQIEHWNRVRRAQEARAVTRAFDI